MCSSTEGGTHHASKEKKNCPFVLTNSKYWSFGLAKRGGTKIEVIDFFELTLRDVIGGDDTKQLVYVLRKVLRGEWPRAIPS